MRVVLDTNVLVSALLFRGRLASFVGLWQSGAIVPLISRETFDEFRAVLTYPKFALTGEEIRGLVEDEILPFFEVVETTEQIEGACRDPHDDKFLAVAINGRSTLLVTGDEDLLALKRFRSVEIVTPQKLLERVRGSEKRP